MLMKEGSKEKILVYRIGQLGDTIVALPAIWAIRRGSSSAYLALLSDTHPGTDYVLPESVLPVGLFDEYILYESDVKGLNLKNPLKLLTKLRRHNFDTVVYLAPRFRTITQMYRDYVFFRLAGIRKFVGYRSLKSSESKVRPPLGYLEHESDFLLKSIYGINVSDVVSGSGCMDLCLSGGELAEAERWLGSKLSMHHNERPLIGLGPGGKMASKRWPLERYGVVGKQLVKEFGAFLIVFGGTEDRGLYDRLSLNRNDGANAAGELNVRQAAAALSLCQLYIGNDTGTMHLAAAVGTQCIAVFSARDWPGRWYPYGDRHLVLRRATACEGCLLTKCVREDMACLRLIQVSEVLAACYLALGKKGYQALDSK